MDTYLSAQLEVLILEDQEEAVAIGLSGEGLEEFDLDLRAARLKSDIAKRAVIKHIDEHGC